MCLTTLPTLGFCSLRKLVWPYRSQNLREMPADILKSLDTQWAKLKFTGRTLVPLIATSWFLHNYAGEVV